MHSSSEKIQVGFECAKLLRKIINPHILRRSKLMVAKDLPSKTEKILFCGLTDLQIDLYKHYLRSKEVSSIFQLGMRNNNTAFRAIVHLRKICNHPDLVLDRSLFFV